MITTLEQLLDKSLAYDSKKSDYTFPKEEVFFDGDCNIVVPTGGWDAILEGNGGGSTRLPLTDWALSQVCDKLGPPPASYMRNCPPELRARNLEHWRTNPTKDGRPWFIREYEGKCRAILSDAYTPIPNSRYLKALIDVVEDTPYEISRPYVDPDRMFVRLCVQTSNLSNLGPDEKGKGGNYGIGFQSSNGETGGHMLYLRPYTKRISCDNSIIYDDERLEIKHIHHTPSFVFGAIKEWAGKALRIAQDRLDKIVEAELERIPSFGSVVAKLAENNKWNDDTKNLIMIGCEGNQSRMGLVNGISYAGRWLEDADPEESLALELFSGAVLMNEKNFVTQLAANVDRAERRN